MKEQLIDCVCPNCGESGTIDAGFVDDIENNRYKLFKCPQCKSWNRAEDIISKQPKAKWEWEWQSE